MVLLSASTILPMFMLWSQICRAIHQLQTSSELDESVCSPFWAKPLWSMGKVVVKSHPAPLEVGLPQRVDLHSVRPPLQRSNLFGQRGKRSL